jgi:hypothetical protein
MGRKHLGFDGTAVVVLKEAEEVCGAPSSGGPEIMRLLPGSYSVTPSEGRGQEKEQEVVGLGGGSCGPTGVDGPKGIEGKASNFYIR